MEAESRKRPEVEFLKRPLTSIVCGTHRPKSAVMLVRGTGAQDRVLHIESDWDRRMNKYMLLFSVSVVFQLVFSKQRTSLCGGLVGRELCDLMH